MRLERQVLVRHGVGSSADRRRTAVVTTQVLLWRTLAAGCVALGLGGLLAQAHHLHDHGPTKSEATRLRVLTFAFEAFPRWAAEHHVDSCPASLGELTEYTTRAPIDAWGTPLEMRCGPWIRGIYVRSAGEDGRFDTADDITSNDG